MHNTIDPKDYPEIELMIKEERESGQDNQSCWSQPGWTLLQRATIDGDTEMVQLLLEHGAHLAPTEYDQNYWCPRVRHFIVENGFNALDNLSQEEWTKLYTVEEWSELHEAASRGYTQIVQLLLDYDAYIDQQELNDMTPLILAIINGHTQTAQVLIDAGAKIYLKDGSGNTALHYAAGSGNTVITDKLLKNGAYINEKNVESITPLMLAVSHGYQEIVNLLLEYNANVHETDDIGFNAFNYAVESRNSEIALLLINHCCTLNQNMYAFAKLQQHYYIVNVEQFLSNMS